MGIDVAWVTERIEHKQDVYDPQQILTKLATSRWPTLQNTVCLRFIDAFGNTLFTQSQIPVLIKELQSEVEETKNNEIKSHLEKVIRLVERAIKQTHTYIEFIGD